MNPRIDPKSLTATGVFAKSLSTLPGSFYNGEPGRELVECPDCCRPADAMFGDHGGTCASKVITPNSALGIIRRHALRAHRLSMNELRAEFDKAGVKESSRGPAFGQAARRGWIERDGSIPSTGGPTKGHHLAVYRSLIHPDRTSVEAARAER